MLEHLVHNNADICHLGEEVAIQCRHPEFVVKTRKQLEFF